MSEVSDGKIQMVALDHHGLVAAICQDLKITQRIDDRLRFNVKKRRHRRDRACDNEKAVSCTQYDKGRSTEITGLEQP